MNIISKKTTAVPLGEKTQELPDKWSPKARQNGWGFAMAFVAKELGVVPFEIANTNSMLPLFDYDHVLYCAPLKMEDKIDMYDVCIYEDLSGAMIVHRVVKVDYVDNRFYFKGDNNLFADGWVPKDRIKYRVIAISYAR